MYTAGAIEKKSKAVRLFTHKVFAVSMDSVGTLFDRIRRN